MWRIGLPLLFAQFAVEMAACNFTDPVAGCSSIANGSTTDPVLLVHELTKHCPTKCDCLRRLDGTTVHVNCSNRNLSALPRDLPELPDTRTKYKLDFSNNRRLRRLEHRDYFAYTSILDVSNSGVDDIRSWKEIVKIPYVNLSGNNISSLPRSVESLEITGQLNLENNPWHCSCDSEWMSDWTESLGKRLIGKVLCRSPSRLRRKNIRKLSEEELCVDVAGEAVKKSVAICLAFVGGVFSVLLLAGVVAFRLRVQLYARWKIHPFDRDECHGEGMDFDVFLCVSSDDDDAHGRSIRSLLQDKGYRVWYPEHDVTPGENVLQSTGHVIEHSKRTVCLLTEQFLSR